MKKLWWIVIPIIAAALFFYWLHFGDKRVSSSNSEWGSFSEYMSFAISLCSLVVFIILTTQIHRYNRDNDRPIISFITYEKRGYDICNVGKGTAINCRLSYKHKNDIWEYNYKINHIISRSDETYLPNSPDTNEILCNYSDTAGNEYLTYMESDRLTIVSIGEKPGSKEAKKALKLWQTHPKKFVHFPSDPNYIGA